VLDFKRIFRGFRTSFSTCYDGITYLLRRYHLPATTVSPTCYDGITGLLERYHRVATTVFCRCWNGSNKHHQDRPKRPVSPSKAFLGVFVLCYVGATTVSRGRYDGSAYPLERYHLPAVSPYKGFLRGGLGLYHLALKNPLVGL